MGSGGFIRGVEQSRRENKLQLVPRSRMRGTTPHLPQYDPMAWHGTYLSTETALSFTFAIATGYGLDDRGSGIRFLTWAGNFSLLHRVQTGSGAHTASYPMGTGGTFPGVKAAGP
jgi:hypothetical protein